MDLVSPFFGTRRISRFLFFFCLLFRVLANYLMWLLLMDLAPETTEALRQQQHEYRRILQVSAAAEC